MRIAILPSAISLLNQSLKNLIFREKKLALPFNQDLVKPFD